LFFRAVLGAPLGPGQKIDKEFRVVEAAGIAPIVGPADLADDLLDFWKLRENGASALGDCDSGGGASARGEGAADPDSAFIEVREKLRADNSAEE